MYDGVVIGLYDFNPFICYMMLHDVTCSFKPGVSLSVGQVNMCISMFVCLYVVSVNGKDFVVTFLHCMLWGMLLHFMAGYFFLHSWSNMFGELLRFADREFYSVRSGHV